MAAVYGRLGANDLNATTATEVYAVPSNKHATVTINVCNRGSSSGTVRVAHMDASGTAANEDYIEYETTVPAYGTLERSGVVMKAASVIEVYASSGNFSAQVWGFEEDD
jgi:hypothetical protein|tara:strand:- start:970 stop:1296 length:327 start_codon:yes stop_codon:yes gene_type:complete